MERFENTFDIEKCMQWKQGTCVECASGLELNSTGLCTCKWYRTNLIFNSLFEHCNIREYARYL